MFAFLNGSLSGATSRFLTYEFDIGDRSKLNKIFSVPLNIHIFVALVVLLLAATVGLWFLETKLIIPAARMNAVRLVYQLSIIVSMISVIQVPYNASLISHECFCIYEHFGCDS